MRFTTTLLLLILTTLLAQMQIGSTAPPAQALDKSSWPNFRNGHELRGVAERGLPEKLELLWSQPIPDGMVFTSAVAVVGGRVYASTLGGELQCLELKSGKLLWKYLSAPKPTPDTFIPGFPSAPTVSADTVFVGDEDGVFHAVDRKTGKRLWVFATRAQVNSSPVIAGDRVYFGSADKHVYGVDLETGKEVWKYRGKSDFNAAPSVAGGRLLIGSEGSKARLLCFGAK